MKKKIFTLGIALAAAFGASAQMAPGSVAPDFTLKDINGNTHHLYDYLNAGKTVILDLSASWCSPCWNYHHNVKALEDVWKAHGPTGGNGVNAGTTNDVMVIMIEAEATNSRAQLSGTGTAGHGANRATDTEGDWVTGTLYPIIDTNAATTNAINTAWNLNYFPTVYMICRDRLVYEVGQASAADIYTRVQQGCPTTAPSATTDAKAVVYTGTEYFYCNANPSVKFQNYSTTSTITSATIKIYSGSTVVATVPWTGSLAPYQVATVSVPSFAGTTLGGYKYDVTVTGDSYVANNVSPDSAFKIYTPAIAASIPYTESFEGLNPAIGLPYKYSTAGSAFLPYNTGGGIYQLTSGYDGTAQTPFLFNFYSASAGSTMELVLGGFNSAAATNVALNFYVAYSPYSVASPENDKLEVLVSNDCGATWQSAWSKSGTTLQTRAAANAAFTPNGPAQWRQETANLTSYKGANMLVKFKGTSAYGNYCWIDALKISPTLGVNNVNNINTVKIYPNPSNGVSTISFNLSEATNVQVSVVDATGRVVTNVANEKMNVGAQEMSLNTSNLAAGVYNVLIKTEQGAITQRLSVVK